MRIRKKYIPPILIMICGIALFCCACIGTRQELEEDDPNRKGNVAVEESEKKREKEKAEQLEKGYDLPIDKVEREEAETDSKKLMESFKKVYEQADKGTASNVVLSEETICQIESIMKKKEYPLTTMITYSNMDNYEKVDDFLQNCINGKSGSVVIYEIHSDGGIGRCKYIFDGTDIYVLSTRAVWNERNEPGISFVAYTRIKEWKYTERGWFCYELCVPEPPEVTEIVDGSRMIRVKPIKAEYQEISKKCVFELGYQGNNLLCSNWDTEHLEKLDYNGVYEYLYRMKYHKAFPSEEYQNGISRDEFEGIIMEYIPVTAEQIEEYAVFDKETQTYAWTRLGCMNYAPSFFGTSMPEVVDKKENEDGTVTLTVDAICEMVLCDDAVITHELTIRFSEDGSFQYLGNKILNNEVKNIPDYQYRIRRE